MKKLTIVFPVYNDQPLLDRALEALSNQTCKDFSVILVNDKSPTNYDNLLSKWRNHLDITLIENEHNLGAMNNIWKSIQLEVSTPYIMSHHSDDFLKINYVEKVLAVLDKNEKISFVVTGAEWITKETSYRQAEIKNNTVSTFDAAEFTKNILEFAPYIFGSVVYREADLVNDWKFDVFYTYCDRYFLGKILQKNQTRGAFIFGEGILERDHSLDKNDNRATHLNEDHMINLMIFYRNLLLIKYPRTQVDKIITNNTIYYLGNLNKRSSFLTFYKKQKEHNLIKLRSIQLKGLLALTGLMVSYKKKLRLHSFLKRIKN